jgi:putative ABC transport system permease protein
MVTGMIITASPWWLPQYFLPLGGMIIGNSMNALALALERLFADLRAQRDLVDMKLSLGANYREASEDMVRRAIKAGMIPSINSLMGVGIVFIPGMMTGQIVAGADPLAAVRYQIVVMLMLVASTTISTLIVVLLTRRRCFGGAQQLILP